MAAAASTRQDSMGLVLGLALATLHLLALEAFLPVAVATAIMVGQRAAAARATVAVPHPRFVVRRRPLMQRAAAVQAATAAVAGPRCRDERLLPRRRAPRTARRFLSVPIRRITRLPRSGLQPPVGAQVPPAATVVVPSLRLRLVAPTTPKAKVRTVMCGRLFKRCPSPRRITRCWALLPPPPVPK